MNFIASNYHRFAENLIIIRATHFMSLRGIANGDAVAISRKGIRVKFYTLLLLYASKSENAVRYFIKLFFPENTINKLPPRRVFR